MPRPLSVPLREEIVRRHRQGHPLTRIAADLAIPYGTVRNIWRRARRHDGEGLAPDYRSCGRPVHPRAQELLRIACDLKRGPSHLGRRLDPTPAPPTGGRARRPSVRSLQLASSAPGSTGRGAAARTAVVSPAVHPHEIWQVDAVEQVPLATGRRISWLTVTDEVSGAILAVEVSPRRPVGTRPPGRHPRDVSPGLRSLGPARPGAGQQRLSLGHAARPTLRDGAVADRAGGRTDLESRGSAHVQSQGGAVQRPDPAMGRAAQLRRRGQAAAVLAEVARIQREEYPAIRGRTRLGAFPQLVVPRREYGPADEGAMWDLSRVDAFLARGCWRRRADCNGRISIYGHGRSVGRAWARQEVVLRFDASSRRWMVSDRGGELVKQIAMSELTRERIMALAVSRRR